METVIAERDELLMARVEDDGMVFEVNFETVEATDVTLRFRRNGEKVGSVYNDDGTNRTMARLTVPGDADFIGVEVPKSFVAAVLDAAADADRLADPEATEGYRLRVLGDNPDDN
ncbi:MAG: hypothetical protein ABEJ79_01805 [Halolamina sp.]